MNKVFRVIPKRIKQASGTMLTPEMGITVTTRTHDSPILQWCRRD